MSNALAYPLGNRWYYLALGSGVFGYYNVAGYPYVLHDDLGWEYVVGTGDGQAGVYLHDFTSASWWYTGPVFSFPYLYDFKRRATLFYYPDPDRPDHGSSQPRYFYDFAARRVITL